MFELTILTKGGRELKRFEISGTKPIKVGRALDCDIKIGVPQVSRRHAVIEQIDENEWIFTDQGSTHGSFVGGERVTEVTIESGLEVEIGPAVLRFEDLAHRLGQEMARSLRGDSVDEETPEPEGGQLLDETSTETVGPEEDDAPTRGRGRLRLPRLGSKKRS